MKTNRPSRPSPRRLGWVLIGTTLLALASFGSVLRDKPAPANHHAVVLTLDERASARNALPGF